MMPISNLPPKMSLTPKPSSERLLKPAASLNSYNRVKQGVLIFLVYRLLSLEQRTRLEQMYLNKCKQTVAAGGNIQLIEPVTEFCALHVMHLLENDEEDYRAKSRMLKIAYQMMKSERMDQEKPLTLQNLYDGVRNSTREAFKDQNFISEVRNLIIQAKREIHKEAISRMTKLKMSS